MTAMSASIEPTDAQLAALVALDTGRSVTMLNLLRYAEVADYTEHPELAPEAPISGRAAYDLYSANTLPLLAAAGGEVVMMGACHPSAIAPEGEEWDDIVLVRYPSVAAFVGMVTSAQYQAGMGHRTAALADSRLVPTDAATL